MNDTTVIELTPYQRFKAREKAKLIAHLTKIMILAVKSNRLGNIIETVNSRIRDQDKEGLYEHLRATGNSHVVDKIEEAVEKTTEKFNCLLKLLDDNEYFKFFTQYSILPQGARWVFNSYVRRGESFFGEYGRKAGELAQRRLFKIEMITDAFILDTKSVLLFAFDKEPHSYSINSDLQVVRKPIKRKRILTNTAKTFKGGEFVFFIDNLYKFVVINKHLPAQPNNVRMLKI